MRSRKSWQKSLVSKDTSIAVIDACLRKLLRESLPRNLKPFQRISSLQRDLISAGQIFARDDLESTRIKLRQFIDRVKTASTVCRIFDAIKIKEVEQVYRYDAALLGLSDMGFAQQLTM